MHWLQRKKSELISINHFWKNETWPSKKFKKFYFFFYSFSCFFSKQILVIGVLNAFMKCHVLYTLLEKIRKNRKKVFVLDPLDGQVPFFHKWSIKMSSGFLCFNQCIKTLLLSYRTLPSGDCHFLPPTTNYPPPINPNPPTRTHHPPSTNHHPTPNTHHLTPTT